MTMHMCDDNGVMVFNLVEVLRGPVLEYYNSLPAEIRGQLPTLCTLFETRFAEQTLRMAADGYSGMWEGGGSRCWPWMFS